MFFKKLFGLFFIGLLIFGLLGFFGRSSGSGYDSAYRQGFIDGQQAAVASGEGAEGAAKTVPDSASGTNIYYRGHDFFFPAPALLLCLVPLFAIGFMMMASGKRGRHGRRGGWGPCGPGRGPWGPGPRKQWEDSPSEKSPEDIDDGSDEAIKYA